MRALRCAGDDCVSGCEWGRCANQDSRANVEGADCGEEGRRGAARRKTRGSGACIAIRGGGKTAYGTGAGAEKREKARRGVPAAGGVCETLRERGAWRARGAGSWVLRL